MNIENIGGVHDNGSPRLQIGMGKNNGFIIEYNTELKMITITDSTTGAVLPVLAPTASPFTFRGQYTSYTDLTNAVSAKTIVPAAGDTYSIINAGGTDANGTAITALCNVAYGNGKWYVISK
nr:MAG TPA: hypothetical protein [Caudoviricetes sp.]